MKTKESNTEVTNHVVTWKHWSSTDGNSEFLSLKQSSNSLTRATALVKFLKWQSSHENKITLKTIRGNNHVNGKNCWWYSVYIILIYQSKTKEKNKKENRRGGLPFFFPFIYIYACVVECEFAVGPMRADWLFFLLYEYEVISLTVKLNFLLFNIKPDIIYNIKYSYKKIC